MMSRENLEKAASAARDTARRARRLARSLTQASDRERLNRFAEETDERAAEMEAEAEALRPITPRGSVLEHEQAQQQQAKASGQPRSPGPTGR